MEIINIGAFMAAAYKIMPGIIKITNAAGQIKTYEYTVNDLIQINEAGKRKENSGKKDLESIEFRDVAFSHKNKIILNDFNFNIRKGDFTGISGPSGKGKTTFINLLLGFLSPDKGAILINAVNAGSIERQHYWKRIAYVQQRPFFIHDSIQTNITLDEININEARLREVINATGLNEFIKQSAEGLKKIITENGKNISGGQRQRIAIARALYKNAELIILDESFSELDTHSEQHILTYLKSLQNEGKMIIMITHKKENLSYCDKTYVID